MTSLNPSPRALSPSAAGVGDLHLPERRQEPGGAERTPTAAAAGGQRTGRLQRCVCVRVYANEYVHVAFALIDARCRCGHIRAQRRGGGTRS